MPVTLCTNNVNKYLFSFILAEDEEKVEELPAEINVETVEEVFVEDENPVEGLC